MKVKHVPSNDVETINKLLDMGFKLMRAYKKMGEFHTILVFIKE